MIQRSTLREQLADALREEILAGRLAPGRDVTVREVAESYGVSATPAREALLDLDAQGLLHTEQHRGYQVRRFLLEDFRALVETRELLGEGLLLRDRTTLVLPGGEPAALAAVRRRAVAARQAALTGDLDTHIRYDLGFWRALTGLLANPCIAGFLDRVRLQCWVFAVPRLRLAADLPQMLWTGHPELAEAVEQGDGVRTGQLLCAFRDHAWERAVTLDAQYHASGRVAG